MERYLPEFMRIGIGKMIIVNANYTQHHTVTTSSAAEPGRGWTQSTLVVQQKQPAVVDIA